MPRLKDRQREEMVQQHVEARGITDPRLLEALRDVDRQDFVPDDLLDFAYHDAPLPIDEEQTISQPYIVALTLDALELTPADRLLDVGTGSGYAAAIASHLVREVWSIERRKSLADSAAKRLVDLGFLSVHVVHGDGSKGLPAHAPYDAIMVGAAGPDVPRALREQLAIGGRMVIPVGDTPRVQSLLRIRRTGKRTWTTEDLGPVMFVPLIGEEGFHDEAMAVPDARGVALPTLVRSSAEPFEDIASSRVNRLLERMGDAKVVCIGEASHGTAEFYEMRARITRALIEEKGFTVVALEADWPEAQRLDRHVRGTTVDPHPEEAFDRFPTWMWANRQVMDFVDWLETHNHSLTARDKRVGIYGLDLYSLHRSIASVLRYLSDADPDAATVARRRYGCLDPWEQDPAAYGAAVLSGRFRGCENDVVGVLAEMMRRRVEYAARDPERSFDAERNAALVAGAEEYYRVMYYGSVASWNLRDQHMFDTLQAVLEHRGPDARAVVWAHNSHLGDARWTEMGARGEHNVGQLVRERYGEDAYLIGFGTDHGTVAAASDWEAPMEIKQVRPSHEKSYERVCHECGVPRFFLPLRAGSRELKHALGDERLERAIGVIYRPETEVQSHYFSSRLPRQFDEWIWFDETRAVDALDVKTRQGMPETYPFAV